jgi:hypothetical protein
VPTSWSPPRLSRLLIEALLKKTNDVSPDSGMSLTAVGKLHRNTGTVGDASLDQLVAIFEVLEDVEQLHFVFDASC